MPKQYSIATARDNLAKLVHEAEDGEAVEIARRGDTVAVVVSATEYRRLRERERPFFSRIGEFRAKHRVAELGIDPDEIFEPARDREPGRDFSF